MADDKTIPHDAGWFAERLSGLNDVERKFRRAYLGVAKRDVTQSAVYAGIRPGEAKKAGAALEEKLVGLGLLVEHDEDGDFESASPDEVKHWLTEIMRGGLPDAPGSKVRNQLAAATALAKINGMLHKVKDVEVPDHLLKKATDEQLRELAEGKPPAEVFGIAIEMPDNVVPMTTGTGTDAT